MTQLQPDIFVNNRPDTDGDEEEDYFDYFYDEPGSEPGTLIIEPDAKPSRIILIDYDEDNAVRKVDITPNACAPYIGTNTVSWMDIQGLGSETVLKQVGEIFNLHPLLLEDVVNVPQRPKLEDYNNQLLVISQMVRLKEDESGFDTEQVSFVLGKRYLLSFQEEELQDCFEIVRDRIRTSQGRVRKSGADYLTYLLLDTIIDGYFPVVEHYEDRIEALEDMIISNPDRDTMQEIYDVRRELLALRRLIWPMRNVLHLLMRDHHGIVSDEVQIYFRDSYDHVIQILEIIEAYRELAASLMDVYMSTMGNKLNEIMKFLTVISTIFIPLTFIVGVYGMNFENMPELKGEWSYFMVWLVMLAVAGGLIFYFWRKGWFKPIYSLKEEAKT
ncbi:MAG: magnesium/cobalt transporter CorA [Microcystis panniformis Mp_MB_F_20051200_S9]|jgi:magnesium transporter|uniref:Magnesium transport protein CorA n=3 Tax=Microcystis TaxID=1125 RepID=A0A552PSR2_9CHRO|nr:MULTISPECIES: magnesium/cobalt transporter CorA [Microcystis]TRU03339.1 MAG: magnesium/cobalt transporter CorA [Microcystis aeruginosa Ma_AC_P_19900807_S300]TRV44965.1 MAG: magnesium/cobalt transporter CorA [Microcystis panniformis Mp_GB_SS_20050300_S99]TRV46394.1 MAG: magnesium/cobalt transporter CorA [Microcystis panniformis Mp_GB_SS_20050300_S99D]TRV50969.1 MAG: magnesium/cobalt transporter CorA [Microcystis panniformis Mp_MB_F_20080800_S26D]TRV60012.1 MAG: magnesium/cobalt transporter C